MHAAPILRIGIAHDELAFREPGHYAAHLALVDARGVRKMIERERLGHPAEERNGPPLPKAHAELAPVAQLRAAREQVRHLVQAVGQKLADHPSSKKGVSPSPCSRMSKR